MAICGQEEVVVCIKQSSSAAAMLPRSNSFFSVWKYRYIVKYPHSAREETRMKPFLLFSRPIPCSTNPLGLLDKDSSLLASPRQEALPSKAIRTCAIPCCRPRRCDACRRNTHWSCRPATVRGQPLS